MLSRFSFARTLATVPRLALPAGRPFSVSAVRFAHGVADKDLVKILHKEIEYEKQEMETSDFKAFKSLVESFSKSSQFDIADKAGCKEVKLTKKFGNEKITVIFSTDALADAEEFNDPESEEADQEGNYPLNLTVLISKPDGGVLDLAVTMEGDAFFIDNVNYGKDTAVMTEETAEADWQRRGLDTGPVFNELDDTLQ